jgi:hypothetical protein
MDALWNHSIRSASGLRSLDPSSMWPRSAGGVGSRHYLQPRPATRTAFDLDAE